MGWAEVLVLQQLEQEPNSTMSGSKKGKAEIVALPAPLSEESSFQESHFASLCRS